MTGRIIGHAPQRKPIICSLAKKVYGKPAFVVEKWKSPVGKCSSFCVVVCVLENTCSWARLKNIDKAG